MTIRPYEPKDYSRVRTIFTETAGLGNPLANLLIDRRLVADFMVRQYVQNPADVAWVAEAEGEVVGYLLGAPSVRRHERRALGLLFPREVARALFSRRFWKPATWFLAVCVLKTWRRGGFDAGKYHADFPAHLHVNLLREARRRGLGRGLVGRFESCLRARGVRGVYATVAENNPRGRGFFEALGYRRKGKLPYYWPTGKNYVVGYRLVYVKSLS